MKSKSTNGMIDLSRFFMLTMTMTALVLLAYVALQWLHVPSGHLVDWLVGIVSFWWLLLVVTLPWNIHFQAREVLNEAAQANEYGLLPKEPASEMAQRLAYAKRWVSRSLVLALVLHIVSALGLYLLARAGVSAVGYFGAAAALLLTFLRPLIRGYVYLMTRLKNLQTDLRYPREDVLKLKHEVQQCATKIAQLEQLTNPKSPDSWVAQQQTASERLSAQIESLRLALAEQQTANNIDHARLSREAEQAIAQISADGQFLNHVREIIRFVKSA